MAHPPRLRRYGHSTPASRDSLGWRTADRLAIRRVIPFHDANAAAVLEFIAMSILWPMLAQIGWTFLLYAGLTVARQRAVKRGEAGYAGFAHGEEPHHVARITRNLANQFELPVVFYVLAVVLVATSNVTTLDVIAAWVFVAGRVIHTLVQTLTDNVPLRGQVFLINFAAVVVLVGHVAVLALDGLGR
jgi:hypothetical protein